MVLVNLLPWRQQLQQKRLRWHCAMLIAGGVSIGGAIICGHIFYQQRLQAVHRLTSITDEQLQQLTIALTKNQQQLQRLTELQKRVEQLQKINDQTRQLYSLLTVIEVLLPTDVWLTLLHLEQDKLTITGLTLRSLSVIEFSSELARQPMLTNSKLNRIGTASVPGQYVFTLQSDWKDDEIP